MAVNRNFFLLLQENDFPDCWYKSVVLQTFRIYQTLRSLQHKCELSRTRIAQYSTKDYNRYVYEIEWIRVIVSSRNASQSHPVKAPTLPYLVQMATIFVSPQNLRNVSTASIAIYAQAVEPNNKTTTKNKTKLLRFFSAQYVDSSHTRAPHNTHTQHILS